ncbi:MAG TPA: hypothetical protein VFB43_20850 [Terracidiphilus sp.]|nr:hypothetical protein [Terracidiphilus sp.]
MQRIIEELRIVDYKATGTLQRSLDPQGRIGRDEFNALLDAMLRESLIVIEDAEYEKDGEVRQFRKVRLTARGLAERETTALELLISDGMVEEFGGRSESATRIGKSTRNRSRFLQRTRRRMRLQ